MASLEEDYICYLAHMLDEAMQDKLLVTEDREGKNINKAEKWLKANHPEVISKGADEDSVNTTRSFINRVRQEVHNSRAHDCKWFLGVTRLWFELAKDKTTMSRDLMKLDRMLGFLSKSDDMTVQSFDNDLNGLSFKGLADALDGKMKEQLAASKDSISKTRYIKNMSYKIVNASSFDVMKKFLKWTDWCVSKDYAILDTYVHDGIGQMYVCMKDGFEDVRRMEGENFPLDEYGLSLVAVSVDDTGRLNTCTSRWNHQHGASDHVMDEKQLSDLLGMSFYEAFPANAADDILAGYMKAKLPDDDMSKKLGALKVKSMRTHGVIYVKAIGGQVWECQRAGTDVIVHDQQLFTVNDDGSVSPGAPKQVDSICVDGFGLTAINGAPEQVNGTFDCQRNDFKDLRGSPKHVTTFDCSFCYSLTSLAGAPDSCMTFKCIDCRSLKSLTGLPERFSKDGVIDCSQSSIESLRGCPAQLAKLDVSGCKLHSLAGAPQHVNDFNVSYNEIVTLAGCPQQVNGKFDCSANHLRSLQGGPARVEGDFDCSENGLVTLDGAPAYVGGTVVIKCDEFDSSCRLRQHQIDTYLAFLEHPDPAHTDDTGHYVE